jgi:hypothetical protein
VTLVMVVLMVCDVATKRAEGCYIRICRLCLIDYSLDVCSGYAYGGDTGVAVVKPTRDRRLGVQTPVPGKALVLLTTTLPASRAI